MYFFIEQKCIFTYFFRYFLFLSFQQFDDDNPAGLKPPPKKDGGCFTGSNTVMFANGKRQKMSELKDWDSVLTVDSNGHYVFSPVILFLDRDPKENRQFYVIRNNIV